MPKHYPTSWSVVAEQSEKDVGYPNRWVLAGLYFYGGNSGRIGTENGCAHQQKGKMIYIYCTGTFHKGVVVIGEGGMALN